jgi:hypothetical protein
VTVRRFRTAVPPVGVKLAVTVTATRRRDLSSRAPARVTLSVSARATGAVNAAGTEATTSVRRFGLAVQRIRSVPGVSALARNAYPWSWAIAAPVVNGPCGSGARRELR